MSPLVLILLVQDKQQHDLFTFPTAPDLHRGSGAVGNTGVPVPCAGMGQCITLGVPPRGWLSGKTLFSTATNPWSGSGAAGKAGMSREAWGWLSGEALFPCPKPMVQVWGSRESQVFPT